MENLNKNKSKNKVICILGMHRSGTSMITGLLSLCGLYVGKEEELVEASSNNKKGHWESKKVLSINEKILEAIGGSWKDYRKFPENWENLEDINEIELEAREFVEEMNSESRVWGFKDPRTCITLPFWKKIIPDMIYVIPVRNPLDVAMSLNKRENMSLGEGATLWLKYLIDILENTEEEKRIFTSYEDYFEDEVGETEKVIDFIDDKSVRIDKKKIDGYVDRSLRHNFLGKKIKTSDFYKNGNEDFALLYSDIVNSFDDAIGYIESDRNSIFDNFRREKHLIFSNDFLPKELIENKSVNLKNIDKNSIKTINWFIPNFKHILYGGIYTIFRFANYFQEHSLKNRIIIYDRRGESYINIDSIKAEVGNEFDSLKDSEFVAYNGKINSIPESDASISTLWDSCFINLKFNKTKRKFYFIQDYEPQFYASGNPRSFLAEATYRFGFRGIVNTPGLANYLRQNYKTECASFYPSVDNKVYYIKNEDLKDKIKSEKIKIVFYGRPNNDRNAFALGVAALIQLKEKYGDRIDIVSAGDDWREDDYGLEGIVKNLGRLGSLKEVADLYRSSDIGLVFMFSKHPSYQPFEYMSCGCAVVTNYNKENFWLLKDKYNCLITEPVASCIRLAVSELIERKELRRKIVENGIKTVNKFNWNDECEKIFRYITEDKTGLGKKDSFIIKLGKIQNSKIVVKMRNILNRVRSKI